MTVPILKGHDHAATPIGFIESAEGSTFRVRFVQDVHITREMFESIFGNVGYRVTKYGTDDAGVLIIRNAEILEVSL